jgi:NAD(P)-dependent dehydrogenase (short-subunit alcohol dehydrogenase family)
MAPGRDVVKGRAACDIVVGGILGADQRRARREGAWADRHPRQLRRSHVYTLVRNVCENDWERTVDVQCNGMLNCVGAVLTGMLDRGRGPIISISSDAGRKVFPGLAVYSRWQVLR